jgi:hypothetical protein
MPSQATWSDRGIKVGLFVLWLCLVIFMAWHHSFWRDEVRALSLALQGDSFVEMLKSLHGEGHPAVWYLLLRIAYLVAGTPLVLPAISIGVASAAILLLVLRSPFTWWMIALIVLSEFALFEYSVMARNYGISALLLFLLAALYAQHRDRGILLGVLLALLANTNADSVLLVGAFLLFWLIDILCEQGIRWTPAFRTFWLNVAISAAGVVACLATIYPTYNDAAVKATDGLTLGLLTKALVLPSTRFDALAPWFNWEALGFEPQWVIQFSRLQTLLMSVVMFGSLLGLVRSPGALVAGLVSLIAFSFFFVIIHTGFYRHQALWLVFLVSLYWIVSATGAKSEPRYPRRLQSLVGPASAVGSGLMVLLVVLQVPNGFRAIADAALDRPPVSGSSEFAALVSRRADLRDAIVIADPDFLLEPLPYYIRNRTYLMREERFGRVVRFTKNARLCLNLDDILATARKLRVESGKPVLILLAQRLDPARPTQLHNEGYNWQLHTTPEQVRGFLTSTQLLARFALAKKDESFDVYLFDRP